MPCQALASFPHPRGGQPQEDGDKGGKSYTPESTGVITHLNQLAGTQENAHMAGETH